jgi:hypothetical protein
VHIADEEAASMSEAQNCMSRKPIHDVPPRELEDEELVARSRAGDVGAFRGIATRYYSLVYSPI